MEKPSHPLAEARRARSLSQQELATLVGVHQRTIQNIEAGAQPKVVLAQLLARALGATVEELFPPVEASA